MRTRHTPEYLASTISYTEIPDMAQLPETSGRMADEDRADMARMLGGCGWFGIAAIVVIGVVAVILAVLS